jgi:hypothetical protein
MPERRTRVPFPTPNGPLRDAVEVGVRESTERWSEITLEDGTVFRVKVTVLSAIRIENEFDPEGNPGYALKMNPVVTIASAPASLKRPAQGVPGVPGIH